MPALATTSFDTAALILGSLLVVGALLAGVAHRSFLSLTAVFVVAGFALGSADALEFDPRSGFVSGLATVALIVILFRDGLEVEAEMLQRSWRIPFRALAIATVALISAPLVDAPDGLAWLGPVLVLKLVAAHAVREEPYRPAAVTTPTPEPSR